MPKRTPAVLAITLAALTTQGCAAAMVTNAAVGTTIGVTRTAAKGTAAVGKAAVKGTGAVVNAMVP